MPTFQATATVLGVLLVLGALVSGLARRSFLSLTALFVLAGFVLGDGRARSAALPRALGLRRRPGDRALIVILFRDGLEVEGEMLQRAWHLPLRKLVLAMPLTAGIVAVAAHVLIELTWTECFLLGALLSPTDPVLFLERRHQPARAAPRAPLAQPRVGAERRAGAAGGARLRWRRSARPAALRVVAVRAPGRGARLRSRRWPAASLASRLMPRESGAAASTSIPAHQKSLYALGTAFAAYGVAVLPPRGQRPDRRVRRARSRSASAAPTCARTSRAAPRTSSRSSSSGSSSCSARC